MLSTISFWSCKKAEIRELRAARACLELPDSVKVKERVYIYSCIELEGEILGIYRFLPSNTGKTFTLRSYKDTFWVDSGANPAKLEVSLRPTSGSPDNVFVEAKDTIVVFR